MKSILVVVLILIILGLYFYTEPTKGMLKVTGKAGVKVAKEIANEKKTH